MTRFIYFSCAERQKQGHKDSTSEIYWSCAPAESRKKDQASSSERSSRSSSIYDGEEGVALPSPGFEADSEASRLSVSDMSDIATFSPHHSPRPHPLPLLLPSSPLKRSKSDEANIGKFLNPFILSQCIKDPRPLPRFLKLLMWSELFSHTVDMSVMVNYLFWTFVDISDLKLLYNLYVPVGLYMLAAPL